MSDMDKNSNRTTYFKRDESLEDALKDLNNLIDGARSNQFQDDDPPMILIMGCPRSGSTLMLQWFAALGIFSYPSNLIARFYKNPYIGIRVQQSLLDFDPINQMNFANTSIDFSSKLGKTIGALNPSEYWYYWRSYFNFTDEIQVLSEEELKKANGDRFVKELSAFEQLTGNPLVMKGMLLNWHIPYLYSLNKKFLFINLTRDSFSNAQSLLFAREQYFDTRDKWYSFKPMEYASLKDEDPLTQVAGQVVYTKRAVDDGLKDIPEANVLTTSYSEFCSNPTEFLNQLGKKMKYLGATLDIDKASSELLKPFEAKNSIRLEASEAEYLRQKIAQFENLIK